MTCTDERVCEGGSTPWTLHTVLGFPRVFLGELLRQPWEPQALLGRMRGVGHVQELRVRPGLACPSHMLNSL